MRPTSRLEKPTAWSIGVAGRSQISTIGIPAACRSWVASLVWVAPVSTSASGRRASMARISRSSSARLYMV